MSDHELPVSFLPLKISETAKPIVPPIKSSFVIESTNDNLPIGPEFVLVLVVLKFIFVFLRFEETTG